MICLDNGIFSALVLLLILLVSLTSTTIGWPTLTLVSTIIFPHMSSSFDDQNLTIQSHLDDGEYIYI